MIFICNVYLVIVFATKYNIIAVDSFQPEGGDTLQYIISFLISVMAGVICYYISKWLDRK